jgi:AcrR family transcriptional regulator
MQYLKDDIRKNILEAALAEFGLVGYKRASIRSICHNARTSVGNFYKYFQGKDDIFEHLIGPVYSSLMDYAAKFNKAEFDENTEELFYRLMEKIMDIFRENSAELTILFNNSEGSKYETCKETFVAFATEIVTETLNYRLSLQNKRLRDNFVIYLMSYNLVESIAIILREKKDGDEIRELIMNMIRLYFSPMENENSGFFQNFETGESFGLNQINYISNMTGVSEQ